MLLPNRKELVILGLVFGVMAIAFIVLASSG